MSQYWSWALTFTALLSSYVIGQRRHWSGWLLGLAIQPVWVIYALVSKQYGFLLSAACFSVINAWNLRTWWHHAREDTMNIHLYGERSILLSDCGHWWQGDPGALGAVTRCPQCGDLVKVAELVGWQEHGGDPVNLDDLCDH